MVNYNKIIKYKFTNKKLIQFMSDEKIFKVTSEWSKNAYVNQLEYQEKYNKSILGITISPEYLGIKIYSIG